jgi:hypothetical protein
VTLEEVDGQWQGVVMPFLSGFNSGCMRLTLAPDGSLWVGQTARGWAAKGGQLFALQRVIWNGIDQPFEIKNVTLESDGFNVEFTDRVQGESVTADSFSVRSWYYADTNQYGSDRLDLRTWEISDVLVETSGEKVRLHVDGLIPGRIYEINAVKVRSRSGSNPAQGTAYYTAHRLIKR